MNRLKSIMIALLLFISFTGLAYLFLKLSNTTNSLSIIYVLYVLLVARFTPGYIYGIFASLLAVVSVNYMFTYPYMQLNFTLSGYPVIFLGMLCVSILTSTLTSHIKQQSKAACERSEAMRILNDVSRELIGVEGKDGIIQLVLRFCSELTHTSAVFYTEDPLNALPFYTQLLDTHDLLAITSIKERQHAHDAYITNRIILPAISEDNPISCLYLPIVSHETTWGLLALYYVDPALIESTTFAPLKFLVPQVALAFERQTLSDAHAQLAIATEKEKTKANLLRAVSHDLRTPLTSMIGASSTYLENDTALSAEEKRILISHIAEDANWLLHMVENLLSVTRIAEKTTKVKKTLEPLEEVISETMSRINKRYPDSKINVTIPPDYLLVPMDPTLIEQVILNLLENAIKYSHSTEPILLIAKQSSTEVKPAYIQIQVIDYGVGIAPNKLPFIFDGYSPIVSHSADSSTGMGIGLSICKTIINAHGGTITAENLDKGTAFTFRLPLKGDETLE